MGGTEREFSSSLSEEEYTTSLHLAAKQTERLNREILRLKNSVTYRLGEHLTASIRKPWKLLFLPLTFPYHCFLLGLEKIGRRAPPSPHASSQSTDGDRNNCVVLFPTNGVGFGHFTRMYAVAKAIRKHEPDTEVIFFTPMPTLHVPYSEDFPTYHIAGRYKFKEMSSSQWNGLIEEQLLMILDIHKPKLFMFDGAYPYRGMLNAIRRNPSMRKAWMRRGMFKKGSKIPLDSIQYFDTVIHPGDAVTAQEQELDHSVEVVQVPPILLVKEDEMLSKEEVRNRLGVPHAAEVWYVQLGAGQINDIESEIRITIEALLENNSNSMIVIGESLLGQRITYSNERVRILRDYPNGIYFKGFDYSIQAGGYNSFHEMRSSRIPTIFYPNMNTGMDDQLARCKVAEKEGWGIVVEKRDAKSIHQAIQRIVELETENSSTRQDERDLTWVSKLIQTPRGS
jgi:UDP-N-acetylglucosamine--N-acetylmuramyl-(pentapeptide) pyrophosphoryl-undecaprenol N-acetylglucosamine transferase